jgi:uncharacterized protein (DUF2062 family)
MVTKIMYRWRDYVRDLFVQERSWRRLAYYFSIGSFIAFCPFVGFHTVLTMISAWLFSLNLPLLLLISCTINNPWTMVPIYLAGQLTGHYLFSLYSIDSFAYNPAWLAALNSYIISLTGLRGISIWAFLAGGTLLATLVAGVVYVAFMMVYALQSRRSIAE